MTPEELELKQKVVDAFTEALRVSIDGDVTRVVVGQNEKQGIFYTDQLTPYWKPHIPSEFIGCLIRSMNKAAHENFDKVPD